MIRKVVGYVLLALPFIIITIVMISTVGWSNAAAVWGLVLATVVLVALGVRLVRDD